MLCFESINKILENFCKNGYIQVYYFSEIFYATDCPDLRINGNLDGVAPRTYSISSMVCDSICLDGYEKEIIPCSAYGSSYQSIISQLPKEISSLYSDNIHYREILNKALRGFYYSKEQIEATIEYLNEYVIPFKDKEDLNGW